MCRHTDKPKHHTHQINKWSSRVCAAQLHRIYAKRACARSVHEHLRLAPITFDIIASKYWHTTQSAWDTMVQCHANNDQKYTRFRSVPAIRYCAVCVCLWRRTHWCLCVCGTTAATVSKSKSMCVFALSCGAMRAGFIWRIDFYDNMVLIICIHIYILWIEYRRSNELRSFSRNIYAKWCVKNVYTPISCCWNPKDANKHHTRLKYHNGYECRCVYTKLQDILYLYTKREASESRRKRIKIDFLLRVSRVLTNPYRGCLVMYTENIWTGV